MFSQRPVRYFFRFSQKSLNFLTEGWRVNLKSHLSYDWSHLYGTLRRKKIDKFTAKQKKKNLQKFHNQKTILNSFSTFLGYSGTLGNSSFLCSFFFYWFSLFFREFSLLYLEFSLFCRGFSLFYCEISLFCHGFHYSVVSFIYSAVCFLYFALSCSLFCCESSLLCRKFPLSCREFP